MRYLFVLITLVLLSNVNAKESYPILFAKQGTPLYKALDSFNLLKTHRLMKKAVSDYTDESDKTRKLGLQADKSTDKKDTMLYLKSLRKLQNQHDDILGFSTKLLRDAMQKNDYKEFAIMADFGIKYHKRRPKLKEQVLTYYKKNRKKGKISSLDKIIRYDRNTVTYYDKTQRVYSAQESRRSARRRVRKDIILLSMDGCGYCDKAKALLDSSGKSYRELNIKSSSGARLYRKYNGRGVPIIIIGDKVIRGYSRSAILREIQF